MLIVFFWGVVFLVVWFLIRQLINERVVIVVVVIILFMVVFVVLIRLIEIVNNKIKVYNCLNIENIVLVEFKGYICIDQLCV